MALLTHLSLEEARPLLEGWGMKLASIEPLALGSVNSNFRLRSTQGKAFFARLYEEQDLEGASRELRLLEGLARAGLPVVTALPGEEGGLLGQASGKPFAVFPWVEGESLCLPRVRASHAEAVGQVLARMHLASNSLPRLARSRFSVERLEERLDFIFRAGAAWQPTVVVLRRKLAELRPRLTENLPEGAIHGDLFRDNVLFSGEHLAALLDFESASQGAFIFDLVVCLLAWCYKDSFDLELCRAMLSGYERERPLTPEERSSAEVQAALVCLRFATTRITDFSLRAAPGQPPGRDYRRFLARLAEVERGVLSSLFSG